MRRHSAQELFRPVVATVTTGRLLQPVDHFSLSAIENAFVGGAEVLHVELPSTRGVLTGLLVHLKEAMSVVVNGADCDGMR
jgi:hypothetical protein